MEDAHWAASRCHAHPPRSVGIFDRLAESKPHLALLSNFRVERSDRMTSLTHCKDSRFWLSRLQGVYQMEDDGMVEEESVQVSDNSDALVVIDTWLCWDCFQKVEQLADGAFA